MVNIPAPVTLTKDFILGGGEKQNCDWGAVAPCCSLRTAYDAKTGRVHCARGVGTEYAMNCCLAVCAKVHRVKPQVLQFLLDMVEDETKELNCETTLSGDDDDDDDDCLSDETTNVRAEHCTSPRCRQSLTASEHVASKTAPDCGGDFQQQPSPGITDRRASAETNRVDEAQRLSANKLDVKVTSGTRLRPGVRDVVETMSGEFNDQCSLTRVDDDQQTQMTSPEAASELELTSADYNRCDGETSVTSCRQHGCRTSDECLDDDRQRFTCPRCGVGFHGTAELEQHRCHLKVAGSNHDHSCVCDDCRTPGQPQSCSVMKTPSCSADPPQDDPGSGSTQLETVDEDRDVEDVLVTTSPTDRELTWNTLIGDDSPNQRSPSSDVSEPVKLDSQPTNDAGNAAAVADRDCDVTSGGDGGAVLLRSVKAMLVHVGLECVTEFKRSLLRRSEPVQTADDSTSTDHDERLHDDDERQRVDERWTTFDDDDDEDDDDRPIQTDDRSLSLCISPYCLALGFLLCHQCNFASCVMIPSLFSFVVVL